MKRSVNPIKVSPQQQRKLINLGITLSYKGIMKNNLISTEYISEILHTENHKMLGYVCIYVLLNHHT